MKLRERFLHDVEARPSIADDRPMGSGTTNRHGMPRLPPGQYAAHAGAHALEGAPMDGHVPDVGLTPAPQVTDLR